MPLNYYPNPGEILVCDYSGFVEPEMVKKRPVIIISPRLRRRGELVCVVPLSTTPPAPAELHHCKITLEKPLPAPFQAPEVWAKCDMVSNLARSRLDRFRAGKKPDTAGRYYVSGMLTPDQLRDVRKSVLYGLGLGSLTIHL